MGGRPFSAPFGRLRAGAVALVAAGLLLAVAGGASAQPNVIVIETDDMDMSGMRVMDNLKSLIGDAGVTFDNSLVSFPLCCPSRATFLTGQYAHNNHITSNDPPTGGYQVFENINSLPAWLQGAGYYTVQVGRYLNHYGQQNPTEIPAGWTEWHASVDPSTYRYYNYTINHQGTLVFYGDRPEDYQTDVWAGIADEVIRRRAPKPQPFFMWLTPMAPHDAGPREPDDPPERFPTPVPAPRHKNLYQYLRLPRDPSFNELDISDKPREVRRRRRFRESDIQAMTIAYRQRLETLLSVDEMVAKVVRALADTGELQDTLIVFTSDNGYLQGQHRIRAGKVFLYEPSLRVPLLMRGPGVPRGVHVKRWVANVDLSATILEATGARPGRVQDGRSLFPLMLDAGLAWGRFLLLDAGSYQGVRTDRYVYAEHSTGEKELYDLQTDPWQTRNLWRVPSAQAIWHALAGQLQRLRHCQGERCARGPRLKLSLKPRGRKCKTRQVLARLRGADNHYVVQFSMSVNGRVLAIDRSRPFAIALHATRLGRSAQLRSLVKLKDGRSVTIDRRARGC
jgi:arylsulfatase A-like enzyme